MKLAALVAFLVAASCAYADPRAVEESLRHTPPGSTDLIRRPAVVIEARVVYGPLDLVVCDWKPSALSKIREGQKELFIPAEKIQLTPLSILPQTEE